MEQISYIKIKNCTKIPRETSLIFFKNRRNLVPLDGHIKHITSGSKSNENHDEEFRYEHADKQVLSVVVTV